VLEEIEELTNPKVKAGKKALSADQVQLKASILAVLDAVRDESGKDDAGAPGVRAQEPHRGAGRTDHQLLAHTSLETSAPINLTMVGRDGRPTQKSLRQILSEWIDFRQVTVARRTQHRLDKVLDRIHVLEGRQLVLLNIDEVIRIIRESDEPKPALIARFNLSDRQAEDILEIRLRQLARLEAIKIEQELKTLREEQGRLEEILGSPAALRRTADQGDRGRHQGPWRRPPHADPGREAGGGRDQGGRRAGHRGGQPEGLGAGAQGPRGGRIGAAVQGR
jgi:topoisomerase-4 subunit A